MIGLGKFILGQKVRWIPTLSYAGLADEVDLTGVVIGSKFKLVKSEASRWYNIFFDNWKDGPDGHELWVEEEQIENVL